MFLLVENVYGLGKNREELADEYGPTCILYLWCDIDDGISLNCTDEQFVMLKNMIFSSSNLIQQHWTFKIPVYERVFEFTKLLSIFTCDLINGIGS